ncbi:hypothetical protein PoB_002357800 [Plakobranchus ocellatus]|uniref:Uncharacterized protein n=1 Tax=Plakobranchus ocellatus TaxID=259542 RepID=A0AAV3ZRJ3_9GAST|nr:hypothetical protein PoB_002357800 [Plakobranchus ocellatus]
MVRATFRNCEQLCYKLPNQLWSLWQARADMSILESEGSLAVTSQPEHQALYFISAASNIKSEMNKIAVGPNQNQILPESKQLAQISLSCTSASQHI